MFRTCYRGVFTFVRPFALDLKNGELTALMSEDISGVFHPRSYGWNPDLTKGISSNSSLICSTLVWLTPEGLTFPSFTIQDGQETHEVSEDLYPRLASDCEGKARADAATWSPDGKHIAFFFSDETDLEGIPRLDAPEDIYLLDPESLETEQLISGLIHSSHAEWSPDSRWVAFGADIDSAPGTWLFSPETKELRKIAPVAMSVMAWSPDGTRLVAAQGSIDPTDLFLLDTEQP